MNEVEERNCVCLLTPPGAAAIAVVRLAGPLTLAFLQKHFSKAARVGRCVHGMLSDGQLVLDDPVVVLLDLGGAADLNLHGGPWVIRSVLDLARRSGFGLIAADAVNDDVRFTDGNSAIEREALENLPLARTALGVRTLLAQIDAWAEFERSFDANSKVDPDHIRRVLDDRALWHLLHPPRVAIVGAANVGKSTLANQLFAQERSITADLAGTTRDWVGEIAEINGLPVMLLDTPGLRETDDAIEQSAITASLREIKGTDLIVLVLDASRPLEPEQSPLLAKFPGALLVLNKSDRPPVWDASRLPLIHTVATTGSGLQTLRDRIAGHFGCADLLPNQPRWWTERQRAMLESVLQPFP